MCFVLYAYATRSVVHKHTCTWQVLHANATHSVAHCHQDMFLCSRSRLPLIFFFLFVVLPVVVMADELAANTGLSLVEAASYMEMAGSSLDQAVSLFFDMQGGGSMPDVAMQETSGPAFSPAHVALFGSEIAPVSWSQQGFEFSTDPAQASGLVQHKSGPCSVLAVVNALLISQAGCPQPTCVFDDGALSSVLAKILVRCAQGGKVTIANGDGLEASNLPADEAVVTQHLQGNANLFKRPGGVPSARDRLCFLRDSCDEECVPGTICLMTVTSMCSCPQSECCRDTQRNLSPTLWSVVAVEDPSVSVEPLAHSLECCCSRGSVCQCGTSRPLFGVLRSVCRCRRQALLLFTDDESVVLNDEDLMDCVQQFEATETILRVTVVSTAGGSDSWASVEASTKLKN